MITVQTDIKAPLEFVWEKYNNPADIQKWNHATPDWHCPKAESEFIVGGHFSYTMAAKDGSFSFDFAGRFVEIEPEKKLIYEIADGRKVEVFFSDEEDHVHLLQSFEPESQNPEEMQRGGWQAILDNFKQYVESNK